MLVLAIGQRLGGRHGDRVAGVDPHRVEVLDGADTMMITLSARSRMTSSSNSFHPSSDCSTSTDLGGGRQVEALGDDPRNSSRFQAMPPPAPPSVNDGRITIARQPDLDRAAPRPRRGWSRCPTRPRPTPISTIASLKRCPILGEIDGIGIGADELRDAVLLEHPRLVQLQREVEPHLPPDRGEHRVGASRLLDDLPRRSRGSAAPRTWRRPRSPRRS